MSKEKNVAEKENKVPMTTAVENTAGNAAAPMTTAGKNTKPWSENCPWPEPTDWSFHYDEDIILSARDEDTKELLEIKEYFDSLVECGRLNEDYSLNEDYEDQCSDDEKSFADESCSDDNSLDAEEDAGVDSDAEEDDHMIFTPRLGVDYWDDGFDIDTWREDLSAHFNLLKIALMDPHIDPTVAIRSIIHYDFINENLLRQAFTRRSFQLEYGLDGCSEELEFLGDTILSAVLTRELMRQFTENNCVYFTAPFQSKYNEGELTKLRQQFSSKEYLAARARELDLGKYILYGTGEQESESALEDMMEALIGAVTIDCNWDMNTIERVVNDLIYIQLDTPDSYLKKSYYDILNAWHQKRFGCIPVYEVHEKVKGAGNFDDRYWCDIRFIVPENDKEIYTHQRLQCGGDTRSQARERTARRAYDFIVRNGLWKNLSEAGIVPNLENSINQLQELYQKKYLDNAPVYEYEDRGNEWYVTCSTEGYRGWGKANGKVKAKKKAAHMVIIHMMISAGICKDEWQEEVFNVMMEG